MSGSRLTVQGSKVTTDGNCSRVKYMPYRSFWEMNVERAEHRTSNVQRWTSNNDVASLRNLILCVFKNPMSNLEWLFLFLHLFPFKIRCWTFDVRCSSLFFMPLLRSPSSILFAVRKYLSYTGWIWPFDQHYYSLIIWLFEFNSRLDGPPAERCGVKVVAEFCCLFGCTPFEIFFSRSWAR